MSAKDVYEKLESYWRETGDPRYQAAMDAMQEDKRLGSKPGRRKPKGQKDVEDAVASMIGYSAGRRGRERAAENFADHLLGKGPCPDEDMLAGYAAKVREYLARRPIMDREPLLKWLLGVYDHHKNKFDRKIHPLIGDLD